MKKLDKKQMGGSTKTKTAGKSSSRISGNASSVAKKEAPEYMKTSIKTVSGDKSPVRYQKGGTVKPAAKKGGTVRRKK